MRFSRSSWSFVFLVALTLSALCVRGQENVALQNKRAFDFQKAGVRFNNQFSGARLNDCAQIGDDEFQIVIRPENTRINDSAWYAFRVVAEESKTIEVRLTYENGKHRYDPKISRDGRNWKPLESERYVHDRENRTATLTLDVDTRPLWVAGQELIGVKEIEAWCDRLARRAFRPTIDHRKIHARPSAANVGDRRERRFESRLHHQSTSIRRRSPARWAWMAFVGKLTDDSELSKRYRRRFTTFVIPLMNPDRRGSGTLAAQSWRRGFESGLEGFPPA